MIFVSFFLQLSIHKVRDNYSLIPNIEIHKELKKLKKEFKFLRFNKILQKGKLHQTLIALVISRFPGGPGNDSTLKPAPAKARFTAPFAQ
jgi:hypothetical protein